MSAGQRNPSQTGCLIHFFRSGAAVAIAQGLRMPSLWHENKPKHAVTSVKAFFSAHPFEIKPERVFQADVQFTSPSAQVRFVVSIRSTARSRMARLGLASLSKSVAPAGWRTRAYLRWSWNRASALSTVQPSARLILDAVFSMGSPVLPDEPNPRS
jgi:hypothetical protein